MSHIWISSMTIALTFPALALAYNSTARNVTAGDEKVGWVSTASDRSTSEILWSCASIFLVCSWKCVHLNIPRLKESRAGWHKWPRIKVGSREWNGIPCWPETPLLWKWCRKIIWMGVIIIAPKIGVYIAFIQLLDAQHTAKQMKNSGWTTTHGHYINMGGLFGCLQADVEKLQSSPDEEKLQNSPDEENLQKPPPSEEKLQDHPNEDKLPLVVTSEPIGKAPDVIKPENSVANLNGGISLSMGVNEHIPQKLWVIDSKTLGRLKEKCPHLRFPKITEASIQDRSKADAFTKAFALVQSGWLVIQSIARVSVGLRISQLELATMAFVFCALVMYILWWDKPFDIEHKTVVTFPTLENSPFHPVEQHQCLNISKFRAYRQSDLTFNSFVNMIMDIGYIDFTSNEFIASLAFYFTGTVFSAIHLGAWNWEFPSSICRLLWRVFAATSTGIPLISMGITVAAAIFDSVVPLGLGRFSDMVENLIVVIDYIAFPVYVISRLGLIVLIFYSFSSMPTSVYETVEWTKYLPHFQ